MIRWTYAVTSGAEDFWARCGGPWLRTDGPGPAHPELCVDDVAAFEQHLRQRGGDPARAEVVARHGDRLELRSPGGFPFTVVPWTGGHPPPERRTSLVDQVCLDISPGAYDTEVAFWAALTGWELRAFPPEFHRLVRPPGLPVHLLLQRTDGEQPPSAHLDLACTDVAAERARHESLGATFVAEFPEWTVMRDPAGGVYCLTHRQPA
ncbi:VOC family protein [Actinoplanes sp. RD1]|uniref:VOC family protein n=1 Tax=Actinoplanes sp. RD1 TaxID=3064538 RepID=UPI002740FEB6|nr:VOC family protein [Actinoplanes sp. RD1]